MNDPLITTKNPFTLTHGTNPATGGLQIMVTAEFSLRDQMRVGSVEHLIARLLGALDDAAEMWKKETA
jgi:hypothetical protein